MAGVAPFTVMDVHTDVVGARVLAGSAWLTDHS